MDVHAEDQLAPRDVLHLVDELPVAVLGGDPLALEEAERMRAGGGEAAALLARDLGDVGAQLAQAGVDLGRIAADGRRDLEHRLHQLGVDPRLELAVVGDAREHRVDVLHEVPRLGIEQHVLLLDPERVRSSGAEAMVEYARGRFGDGPSAELIGRGRSCSVMVAPRTASASISTRQRGSSSPVTRPVVAGRATAKASRWARPTASIEPASVT